MRILRSFQVVSLLAMATLPGAGCQHTENPLARWTARSPEEKTIVVNDRQAADMQVALGRSLEKQGKLDQALAAYQKAQKRDPKQAEAYSRMAILLDRQGKFAESAAQYTKALQREPKNADIYCDLGYSLYLQRRWAEAENQLQHVLALRADHRRAHNNLGLVLGRTDRWDEALVQFQQGGCDPASAHVNLAFVLTLDHRWDDARQQYQAALAANPKLEAAEAGLHNLDTLANRAQMCAASSDKPGAALQAAHIAEPTNNPGVTTSLYRLHGPD